MSLHRLPSRVAAALLLAASGAAAQTFVTPAFRGSADSAFAGWDFFTDALGTPGNAPDLAQGNAFSAALLIQSAGGGFVTGGGNLYSFSAPLVLEIELSTSFVPGTFVLQTRTNGTLPDYGSGVLQAWDGSTFITLGALSHETVFSEVASTGFGAGALEVNLWSWTGSTSASRHRLLLAAQGPHMSLETVIVEAAAIPEPDSVAVAAGVLAGLCLFLRRRF